ncbi:hypothetical protein BDY24DRAFT_95970 [Mrakia frigida]|uniref:uncharacterized protein n=1 Tax=Mrakia frigida TaxID=29902 RepID=UPI003FCBEFA3
MPKPLPRLSWDALSLIFEQADPSTLAALGGVSFDFLEATAPLLYGGEVAITSLEGLKLLFCEREGNKDGTTSRIDPLLSLSRVQTLTLDFTQSEGSYIPNAFTLSSSRIDSDISLIPLQVLDITLPYHLLHILSAFYDRILFCWLNPSRFNLTVLNRAFKQSPWQPLGCYQPLSHWSRITVVDLRGVLPWTQMNGQLYLVGLVPPSLDDSPGRVVRLHLGSLRASILSLSKLVRTLGSAALPHNIHMEGMQTGSFVLIVGTEEEKKEVERGVALCEPASRRSKFKVVIE